MEEYFYIELTKVNWRKNLKEPLENMTVISLDELNEIREKLKIDEEINEDDYIEAVYFNADYEWFDIQGTTYELVESAFGIKIK